MEKYIYDNNNGLWYELQGDYYIPCLVIDKEDSMLICLAMVMVMTMAAPFAALVADGNSDSV